MPGAPPAARSRRRRASARKDWRDGSGNGPKWDAGANDGELVDQPGRFGTDKAQSRQAYEDGMLRTFRRCHDALRDDGRLVVVFANKQPAAWATLVSALIRAGFVVDASWPIQTERDSKGVGADPGRLRRRRLVANPDGAGQQGCRR